VASLGGVVALLEVLLEFVRGYAEVVDPEASRDCMSMGCRGASGMLLRRTAVLTPVPSLDERGRGGPGRGANPERSCRSSRSSRPNRLAFERRAADAVRCRIESIPHEAMAELL
jgi:hypothetical protein